MSDRSHGARLALLLAFVLATSPPALAQGTSGDRPKWGPSIDFEAKPGTKRTLGEADLFVPLRQDRTTLFFGNPRARLDDHDNYEGNFGLGLRRMMEAGWNLGGLRPPPHRERKLLQSAPRSPTTNCLAASWAAAPCRTGS